MHKIKHIRPVLPGIASTSSVSFAGCGALNFYQTGVAYALQETGQTDRLHFLGASAGAGSHSPPRPGSMREKLQRPWPSGLPATVPAGS